MFQFVASQTMKRITVGTQPHVPHSFCLTEYRQPTHIKALLFAVISLNGFLSRILARCLAADRFRSRSCKREVGQGSSMNGRLQKQRRKSQ